MGFAGAPCQINQKLIILGRKSTVIDFDWDPLTAEKMQRELGIAFEDAAKVFGDPNRLDWLDERMPYPEPRRVTVGGVETVFITVVYTMQGDLCRIITAWPANRKKRKAYGSF